MEAYTLSLGLHRSHMALLHTLQQVQKPVQTQHYTITLMREQDTAWVTTKHQWGLSKGLTSNTGHLLVNTCADPQPQSR